ncbi:MAG: hypothetical protein ACKOT0_13550 [bacterium]
MRTQDPRVTVVRVAAAAAACMTMVLALTACASGDASGDAASPAPTSAAPESAAPESAAPETAAPEPAAPTAAAPERGPQYVADAILAELTSGGDTTLTDQLVTIAMSPVTRQLTEQLGLKAQLKTKGDAVLLVISGGDVRCTVSASDPPRPSRGVSCR